MYDSVAITNKMQLGNGIYYYSTVLVKPDGCVRFVQFSFGVLIGVYFYGLFGVYKFNISSHSDLTTGGHHMRM